MNGTILRYWIIMWEGKDFWRVNIYTGRASKGNTREKRLLERKYILFLSNN